MGMQAWRGANPPNIEGNRRLSLVRRVRNFCDASDEVEQLTRIALEAVGTTKGFKGKGLIGQRVHGRLDDGTKVDYGRWVAVFNDDAQLVEVEIHTRGGCVHSWMFSWPTLKMVGYMMESCACNNHKM